MHTAQRGPGAPGISVCARGERGAELRPREELVMVRPGLPCHARALCPACPEGRLLPHTGAVPNVPVLRGGSCHAVPLASLGLQFGPQAWELLACPLHPLQCSAAFRLPAQFSSPRGGPAPPPSPHQGWPHGCVALRGSLVLLEKLLTISLPHALHLSAPLRSLITCCFLGNCTSM